MTDPTPTFETEIAVRYRDLDTYSHVNNAVYATYVEQARLAYLTTVLDAETPRDLSIVIAELTVEFHAPIAGRTTVRAGVAVTDVGETSFEMRFELHTDDELAATARSTQVHIDRQSGRSRALPARWRDRFGAFEEHLD
ncbi:acyl-CoA thioesterase [Halobacteriales archaeon QH_10_67_13]|nr:MAG: acyl-CoA thioesterase [Halobacteriales archaeon QH_10_67_13]